jgi:choline dehydrogenase-like flavoprotein
VADFYPTAAADTRRAYGLRYHGSGRAGVFFVLSEALQRAERTRNVRFHARQRLDVVEEVAQFEAVSADRLEHYVAEVAAGVDRLVAGVAQRAAPPGQRPLARIRLHAIAEQAPNPASRVRLGDVRDRFDQPQVVLDWQLTDADSASIRTSVLRLAREAALSGLGSVRLRFPRKGFAVVDAKGSYHHMGTTRMHDDPSQGVVDRNCRVHGIDNLYVAGSSVFPTYGTCNPTLTIIAVAPRLADHLGEQLG